MKGIKSQKARTDLMNKWNGEHWYSRRSRLTAQGYAFSVLSLLSFLFLLVLLLAESCWKALFYFSAVAIGIAAAWNQKYAPVMSCMKAH